MKTRLPRIIAAIAILISGQAAAAEGKDIYGKACASCHAAGVAGAAKLGDKAKWAPLIKQGTDALVASVIKGKGAMPPKGGAASLSNDDVKAAVEYMISQARSVVSG